MDKTAEELAALRDQSIKHIEPVLKGLTDASLAALLALELAQEAPRSTLVDDIEREQLARLDASGDAAPAAAPEPAEPAWLHKDYNGPLTADQAQTRIARHGHHVTKPVAAPVTK